MTVPAEVLHTALAGGLVLLLLTVAEIWRCCLKPPVEWTRKLVHVGAGAVAATFPWLLQSHWSVLTLSLVFVILLWWTRSRGLLPSVHNVGRKTQGGLYYPLAIYVLFVISHGRPTFYLISMFVLGLSDALAALLGRRYGRLTFAVQEDRRSLEGSAVFFVSTFLCTHLPLLLLILCVVQRNASKSKPGPSKP